MSKIYSSPATWDQMDGDVQVGEVDAVIYFTVTPAGGDGWSEPRYDAQAEFHHVTHNKNIPHADDTWTAGLMQTMIDLDVEKWAAQWVEDNQDACLRVYHDEAEREREYAAESRGDR